MNRSLLVGVSILCLGAIAVNIVSAAERSPRISLVLGSWLSGETTVTPKGPSPLTSPFGIDFDAAGNMIVVELEGGRVHRLQNSGAFNTIAGDGSKNYTGDGQVATKATFNGMHNVAVTPNGDIYIADSWNHCVRKIDRKTGVISTIAGVGQPGFSGDGGPASKAKFDFVMCITLNANNDKLYLADLKNRRVRMIDLVTQRVTTVAGNGLKGVPQDGALATDSPLVDPRAVTVDSSERIYILERGGNALRVVEADGKIYTVAGNGQRGYRDGPALTAQLGSPKHLCVDQRDNVYIADDQNRAVRKYDPRKKTLTTIIGRGHGDPAVKLLRPHGVCVEKETLYIVDTGHNRILKAPLTESTQH